MRGWKDGCTAHAKRKEFTEHPTRPDLTAEYESGYADGFLLRTTTQRKAAKRIGYVPNVLRTQEAKHGT
jgi:hypothetical protein